LLSEVPVTMLLEAMLGKRPFLIALGLILPQ
jgi:hypothetical protein